MASVTKKDLKDIKSLLTKKGRREKKVFIAEGVRLLEEAVRHRFWPRTVYYAPAMLSSRGEKLIIRFEKRSLTLVRISARQLDFIAGAKTSQGIVGLFDLPEGELRELYRPSYRRLLLCENVSDPGNLGTLIRSALAFGFDLLLLCGSSAQAFSPRVVRASAGAVFALPIGRPTLRETLELVRMQKLRLIAADIKGKRLSTVLNKRLSDKRILLAVGSEATGLSQSILHRADYRVRLDHERSVESLNVAVAGSIIMKQIYDICRR